MNTYLDELLTLKLSEIQEGVSSCTPGYARFPRAKGPEISHLSQAVLLVRWHAGCVRTQVEMSSCTPGYARFPRAKGPEISHLSHAVLPVRWHAGCVRTQEGVSSRNPWCARFQRAKVWTRG